MTVGVKAFCFIASFIYFFIKLIPVRKKISIISRQGNTPSLDITLLSGQLREQMPDYELVVKCKMVSENVSSIIKYFPAMVGQMYHIATSKLVILDTYCIPVSILKHKQGLKVLQIWHAMGLMKKTGHSVLNSKEGRGKDVASMLSMHKGYTHILASSPACTNALLADFGYAKPDNNVTRSSNCHSCEGRNPLAGQANKVDSRFRGNDIGGSGNVICGAGGIGWTSLERVVFGALPRADYMLDELVCEKTRAAIYAKYPQLKNKQVILYAPTFRKDNVELHYAVKQLVDELTAVKGDYILVVKLHPARGESELVAAKIKAQHSMAPVLFDETFTSIDFATVASACISDYSTIIYEFMIMNKPTYFFAFDLDEYDDNRGLHIDYINEVPGGAFKNAKELIHAVTQATSSPKAQNAFLTKYVTLSDNGNAKALVQDIIDITNKG